MDHIWLCVLLLLNSLIYCDHSQGRPVLTLQPNWTQIFKGESVTIICNIKMEKDVTYLWSKTYNGDKKEFITTETEYKINTANMSDSGDYTCFYRNKQQHDSLQSDKIKLTVTDLPVASVSVSPHGLIYSGQTVTLQCDISDYTDWTYWWYRNDQLQSPGSASKTITTQSDQVNQYQCQGRRTDRPQSSQLSVSVRISVTVTGPSTSVLVGVFVGLVAAAVLLTIFLVLLCRYKNNKGSSSNISFQPIHPQSTNQDPQQDQGSTQVQSPDAGHTDTAGVSAGSDDVTYAQIQLKKLDKKKKEFTPLPKSESVYSQIKFFKDLGP